MKVIASGGVSLVSFQFIETRRGPLVLLFYDGFEWRARETFTFRIASSARRFGRHAYKTLRGTQVFTGYYSSFRALRIGLKQLGYNVRVNDFATAKANPEYPIGLSGFPSVLAAVRLPNPFVFGPGDFGDPLEARELANDPRARFLIRAGDWLRDMYRPYCGEKVVTWFSPVDTDFWVDRSSSSKEFDVLIYDKIYRERERLMPLIRGELEAYLDHLGLRWTVLRYGEHHYIEYAAALAKSRSLAFLSHHETQGRAALEAMASGVPVFAWDEGEFMDPGLLHLMPEGVQVSSVPYFDETCGIRFKSTEIPEKFDLFWSRLSTFRPRDFVLKNFTLEARAKAYLQLYQAAGESA